MGVAGHKHEWYAISFDTYTNKPVLFACAVDWKCIATAQPEYKGRGKNRTLINPEPQVPTPTRGMWAITEDINLDKAKSRRGAGVGAAVPRRAARPDPDRSREQERTRYTPQAGSAHQVAPRPDPRPDEPAGDVAQPLPTLHPQYD